MLFHIGATMGTVGLLAFLTWVLGILRWYWIRRSLASPAGVAALSLTAIVIGFGLTDMTLLNSRVSGILALGLGATMGVMLRAQEEPS